MSDKNDQEHGADRAAFALLRALHYDDWQELEREDHLVADYLESAIDAGASPNDIQRLLRQRFGANDRRTRLIVSASYFLWIEKHGDEMPPAATLLRAKAVNPK